MRFIKQLRPGILKFRVTLLLVTLFSFGIYFSAPAESPALPPENLSVLTNIAQIRALTTGEAARRYPVHLRATVTFYNLGGLCFIQDSTGAIFVRRKPDSKLRLGQRVELEGTTLNGDWAPIVKEDSIQVLGEGELPPAQPASFDELASGKLDCEWVEIHGVVRSAKYIADHLHLELAVGGGKMRAYVYDYPPVKDVSWLVNSTIRLRGAVGSIFNHKNQFAAPLLFVSGTNHLSVEKPSPADPFAGPARPAGSLMQYFPGMDFGHRVKVAGVVTYQDSGHALFIRDGAQGFRIETQDTTPVKPGDIIEAAGFPVMSEYSPAMEDAIFRKVGSQAAPAPIKATVEDALSGKLDANLVTLTARMLNLVRRGNERILILQSSNVIFNAHLSQTENAPDVVEKGSLVQVTGICSIRQVKESVSFLNPQSFELLLRSPGDVVVLRRPPWWTLSRLLWILSAMAVILLISGAWVVVLNRRVSEQTRIIQRRVQREAVLEERSRIAREFHDTLEQELAGIAIQLDTVAAHLKASPALAIQQLEIARNLSRHSLAEAQRSVWDLRSHLLENSNLANALTEVARPLEKSGPKIKIQISGAPRKLPARVENNLLRITQEALANAVKHANAKMILIRLNYQKEKVVLTIHDDGVGFDVANAPGISGGHFGLLGMRERAERSGAVFSLVSHRESGTEIVVTVPEKNRDDESVVSEPAAETETQTAG
ncbi:MAG TPA: histidine kinase [Verrucomicrobiae bacterium]|nr:histidine kinase [Verrucomicrobiae bacterium]